jgi:hypothetical protein
MSEWHYAKDGQQFGPINSTQLKQLAAQGQLTPSDMIWKDGMAEWAPAGSVKGLFTQEIPLQTQSHPTAVQPVSAISYYNPTGGMSARVQQTLKGFAPPTGMQGEWPLTDTHLSQLKQAESHRKHIRNLASLFQLFFILYTISAPITLLVALFDLSSSGRRANAEGMAMLISAAIIGAMAVLLFFSARETKRCRIWPALVFTILIGLGIVVIFVTFFMAMSRLGSSNDFMIIAPVLWCILPGAVLFMCVKTMSAIPKFLACPVWAQEALVNAKL